MYITGATVGGVEKVIGYLRVSTDEQARSGAGLEAQREQIQQEGRRRNWQVRWVIDDGYGAGDLNRPGIREALECVKRGEADALVAAKLDRLSRSVYDFAGLLRQAEGEGWGLILLDFDLDTTKPSGRLVAHVMSAVAEFERERIAERTREALAVRKASGVRLGRPRTLSRQTVTHIARERSKGATLAAIAKDLNQRDVPTAHGGRRWYPSTVAAVLGSIELDRQSA